MKLLWSTYALAKCRWTLILAVVVCLNSISIIASAQTPPPATAPASGGLVQTLASYQQAAAQQGITPQLAQQFYTTFQQLQQEAAAQLSTTPDKARIGYQALYNAMATPIGRQLFMASPGAAAYQQTGQQVVAKYAEADVMLARRMATNMGMRKQVQDLYAEAVALTQRQNLQYLLGLGDAARINSDMDTAFNALKDVVQNPAANKAQIADAREGLDRIAVATSNRLVLPDLTPTPAATTAQGGLNVVPIPSETTDTLKVVPYGAELQSDTTAADTPSSPTVKYDLDDIWSSIKDGSIVSKAPDIARQYLTPKVLSIIGAIVALFIIFWVLPFQILKFLAKRGDAEAGNRLLNGKKLGFVSLVSYMLARYKRHRDTRHRCPFCNRGIDNMEDYNDLNFVVCPHCREPITPIYNMKDYIDHLIEQLKLSQKASAKGRSGDVLIEKDAMLKLVRGVLAYTIRRRASDFHLETANEGGRIRARIDGIMYDLITLPREISPAFISALKVMANLDITERRIPQDGKIPLWIDNQDFDLRINTSPASMGEKVVIRILRQDSINITPEKLGLDGENLEIYERNIHKPHGVIIVTGPSGSGKSTSLYVALNELNTGDKNIITIEDPIEYQLKGLSQMQVNPGANFTFATGLRSILRQDPDVIMVGEIRDKETAEAALDAAMTGHMVLTTLHTIDAPTAFSRMKDLGIEQARIASAVNLVIAQRLVRTICPDCRKAYKPKAADLEKLGLQKDDDIQFVHGTGCETCMNTGYYGRLALFEMLEMNDRIRSLLEQGNATTAIREAARDNGMRSLREEGLRQIKSGVTTVEEVIRVTTS